jgi:3-deoxy-D-manno-octulosonic-acid transferase
VYLLYNLALYITSFFLNLIAFFNPKIDLFLKGRKETFPALEKNNFGDHPVIWIHTASLGEFEQGLPVMQRLKTEFPSHKIVLTFFSPSGYEIKKNTTAADLVCYMPLDTLRNARKFVGLLRPKIALFVKYEIWPNFLRELERNHIPSLLISAIFKENQVYFKWYGGFMRRVLAKISHFFVQNETSAKFLQSIGINNSTVSGDTRFDRVTEILERDNFLTFMKKFKQGAKCIVAGSTWPEDEKILVHYINSSDRPVKLVIAPHTIKADHIRDLRKALSKNTVLFSELNSTTLAHSEVLIVDTIGLLTKIYSYADIAYVGGGFATGLHNTLEPAVFGIPVIIGPKYSGFKEAQELVELRGIFVVRDFTEFEDITTRLLDDKEFCEKAGITNTNYINKNKGASIQIIEHVRTLI